MVLSAVLKRGFDLIVALLLLTWLLPLLAVVAVLVALFISRRVLFFQARDGLKGRHFQICKFTTMIDRRDDRGNPLPDEQRLTGMGQVLRSTSLDELPELLNVLKGEMSLVGPRPLISRSIQNLSPDEHRRVSVRPGITGWAQINGRNRISTEERLALDLWYVENHNFLIDLKILFLTIPYLLKLDGTHPTTTART